MISFKCLITYAKIKSAVAHMVARAPADPRVVGSVLIAGVDFSPNFPSVKCHKNRNDINPVRVPTSRLDTNLRNKFKNALKYLVYTAFR